MPKIRKICLFLLFYSLIAVLATEVLAVESLELAQDRKVPSDLGKPGRRVSGGPRIRWRAVPSVPSRSLGKPARRVPGASRGTGTTCLQGGSKVLTALAPERNPVLTTSKYPSFLFYVPKTSATALEFVLYNDQDEVVYRTSFKNTGQPGVITLSLPAYSSLPPLEIGKEYYWNFTIICDEQSADTNPTVEGSIRRLQTPQQLQTALSKAQMIERAVLYAEAGFWENTLTTLVQLRQQNPNDLSLRTDWEELLKSVGLGAIASDPIIGE